jgi:hypothetical protein
LLNFFRMSFILFSTLAFLAVVVLMPFNLAVSNAGNKERWEMDKLMEMGLASWIYRL